MPEALSASTLLIVFPCVLEPRRNSVLVPATMSLTTFVSTSGPEPSAWICVLPVVVLRRIMRSLVSPDPTYCRMPAPVLPLPKVTAFAAKFASVLLPTLVPAPGVALLPSELTVKVPAVTAIVPVKVFAAVICSVPLPDLMTPPEPLITPVIVAKSARVALLSSTWMVRAAALRSMLLRHSTSERAVAEFRIRLPVGRNPPDPHINAVGDPVPPMATTSLDALAAKPPPAVQLTSLALPGVAVATKFRVKFPLESN